jgi:hypothetical protein
MIADRTSAGPFSDSVTWPSSPGDTRAWGQGPSWAFRSAASRYEGAPGFVREFVLDQDRRERLYPDDSSVQTLISREGENTDKLAMIRAISRCPEQPEITAADRGLRSPDDETARS